jgi:hypothetical protein
VKAAHDHPARSAASDARARRRVACRDRVRSAGARGSIAASSKVSGGSDSTTWTSCTDPSTNHEARVTQPDCPERAGASGEGGRRLLRGGAVVDRVLVHDGGAHVADEGVVAPPRFGGVAEPEVETARRLAAKQGCRRRRRLLHLFVGASCASFLALALGVGDRDLADHAHGLGRLLLTCAFSPGSAHRRRGFRRPMTTAPARRSQRLLRHPSPRRCPSPPEAALVDDPMSFSAGTRRSLTTSTVLSAAPEIASHAA